MTMTATSGVVSAKNAVFNARGYLPIEERVKKVRLKHGRDRERTSACMAAGHSIDSILSSARPTLVPKGKKNDSRQGYTKTHVGWYKVLKQRKKVHRHKQLHMHSEAITYNMYRQQQKRGHRVHGKTHIWEHWQPTKTPHSTTENCEEETLNRGSPAGPLRPCTLGTPQLQNWEGRKDM